MAWIPDMAVLRYFTPSTVIVEIIVSRNVARNVSGRSRVIFPKIALVCPAVQTVRPFGLGNRVFHVVRAVEFGTFPRAHGVGLAAGGNFAFAANSGDPCTVAIFIDVDTKITGLLHREGEIRRVHFVEITFAKFTHAEIDSAFGQAHLHNIFVEVQEGQRGHAADVNGGLTGLQFRARIFVGPNFIAYRDRPVSCRGAPVARASRLKGYGAFEKTNARDTRRRITLVASRFRREETEAEETGQT